MPYIVFTFVLTTIIQYDNITKSDIKNLENYYSEYIINSVNILNNNYSNNMGEIVVHNFRVENVGYHEANIYDDYNLNNVENDIGIITEEAEQDEDASDEDEVEIEVEVHVQAEVEVEVRDDEVDDKQENDEVDDKQENDEVDIIQHQFRLWNNIEQ